ncbi:MAG: hypothetical protein QXU54_01500 [Candidatus Micrarchaeia archaeon]
MHSLSTKGARAQSSVEILMLLAAVLFVILVGIFLSNEQMTTVSKTKEMNEARIFVDKLASAAEEVYYQGKGARKKVVVDVPTSIDPSSTKIVNNTILLKAGDSYLTASPAVPIRGMLPLIPGKQEVWVTSYGDYVRIGPPFINVIYDPLAYVLYERNSRTSTIYIENVHTSDVNVSLWFEWPYDSTIPLSVSPSFKSLSVSEQEDFVITVEATTGSAGIYDGLLAINSTDGNVIDTVYLPITVYVFSEAGNQTLPVFYANPNSWSQTTYGGATISKYIHFCTLNLSVNRVEFSKSGTAGGWVWNTGAVGPIPPNSCVPKQFSITVPAGQPSGTYTGAITAIADGTYTATVSLSITVMPLNDTLGPLSSIISIRANTSNPVWVIHAYQDDVIIRGRCDDTSRGNSKILVGEMTTNYSQCFWTEMKAEDGEYNSPYEIVTGNLGMFGIGEYFAMVRCQDEFGNIGPVTSEWFGVLPPDYSPPSITSFWLEPSNTPGMSQLITVHSGANDWGLGDSVIIWCNVQIDSNGTNLSMSAEDGAFDEPQEEVYRNIGYLYAGSHNATIFCADYYNNIGSRTYTFSVVDDVGPLALKPSVSPSNPTPVTPVIASAIGDDTSRGDSVINLCRARVDGGPWRNMIAADGSYDSPVEEVTRNMGTYARGLHTLEVQCRQTVGNIWGPINQTTFQVV